MDGDFELNKMGWYKPVNVMANDFLNQKLENDQYGLYYSVRFEGDAETYLWQAKTKPEEGVKVWGHIEESKSGKSMRFKKDKDAPEDDTTHQPVNVMPKPDNLYLRDVTAIPMDVYRVLINIMGVPENETQAANFWQTVKDHSDEVLKLIENVRDAG